YQRQHCSFRQQHAPYLLRPEPKRQECPDLNLPLLHTKLEQQRHQQQRSYHEKDAEPEKELAEILRLVRGFERLLADWLEPQPERLGFDRSQQLRFKPVPEVRCRRARVMPRRTLEANSSEIPESVAPHLLSSRQRNEGLGRAAVVFPIILVLGSDCV